MIYAAGGAAAQLPPSLRTDPEAKIEILGSANLPRWLAEQSIALAFTTYQAGQLFLVGHGPGGRLSAHGRTFPKCMGLWAAPDASTIWVGGEYQLWRLVDVLEGGGSYDDSDRLYVPRVGYTTGDIDVHDIVATDGGSVVFVATALNCLATVDPIHSIRPIWKPPFISKITNQDRCHLNGLALVDGAPGYATATGQGDVIDSWRDVRVGGGCVIDVRTDEIIARGLSMPHSPRWYQDKLWLLNSGEGQFGYVDLDTGEFNPVAFCPGYARGLAFTGHHAIIGLSRPRNEPTFTGLPLEQALLAHRTEPRCGLLIVDLRTGEACEWLRAEGTFAELYDVAVLPNTRHPTGLSHRMDEIKRTLTLPASGTDQVG